MSKRLKDTEYLFLTTNLRAREARMLTREKSERMIDAPSYEESAKLLEECGYEDMSKMNAGEVEGALARHRAVLFEDLSRMSPEPRIVEAFRLKYDYHNVKVLIKAEGVGADGSGIMSASGRVPPESLTEAYQAEDYRFLPDALGKAIAESRAILARTGNPQLADFEIDKVHYAELMEIAQDMKSPFLSSYARLLIDSANLKAAVRTVRMGRDSDFLKIALIPGGNADTDRLSASAMSGDGLASLFISTYLEKASELGASAALGGLLTGFELECDNAVMRFLCSSKLVSFGEDPVIAYIAAVEAEITAARMILTGRLSGIDPVVIRERLRESYA